MQTRTSYCQMLHQSSLWETVTVGVIVSRPKVNVGKKDISNEICNNSSVLS